MNVLPKRPGPQRRNLAAIVVHCAYTTNLVRRRRAGTKRCEFPLKGSNWFEIPIGVGCGRASGVAAGSKCQLDGSGDFLRGTLMTAAQSSRFNDMRAQMRIGARYAVVSPMAT